jgi:hypothetical protein
LKSFSIWGGKEARHVFALLSHRSREKVVAFLDVHPRKVKTGAVFLTRQVGQPYVNKSLIARPIPVMHWKALNDVAMRPVVVCVKGGFTFGKFEHNLESLCLEVGRDVFPLE